MIGIYLEDLKSSGFNRIGGIKKPDNHHQLANGIHKERKTPGRNVPHHLDQPRPRTFVHLASENPLESVNDEEAPAKEKGVLVGLESSGSTGGNASKGKEGGRLRGEAAERHEEQTERKRMKSTKVVKYSEMRTRRSSGRADQSGIHRGPPDGILGGDGRYPRNWPIVTGTAIKQRKVKRRYIKTSGLEDLERSLNSSNALSVARVLEALATLMTHVKTMWREKNDIIGRDTMERKKRLETETNYKKREVEDNSSQAIPNPQVFVPKTIT
ncbi:hypothetical protein IEQ34_006274 [Dendrobium chrysotoxum]|uniref:Uncharacterized protein n=1 Tax=Dendrobium chrysotoxum TaxID=161865 RepID=A0AAV7HAW8_DENCH|nr:hypothetical protein IEQ34_006274 [Dendrobium chrysotoxum]